MRGKVSSHPKYLRFIHSDAFLYALKSRLSGIVWLPRHSNAASISERRKETENVGFAMVKPFSFLQRMAEHGDNLGQRRNNGTARMVAVMPLRDGNTLKLN